MGSDIFEPKENIGGTNPIFEGPKKNSHEKMIFLLKTLMIEKVMVYKSIKR